jgi:FMN-dependent NADH-azoreductase
MRWSLLRNIQTRQGQKCSVAQIKANVENNNNKNNSNDKRKTKPKYISKYIYCILTSDVYVFAPLVHIKILQKI